MEPDSVVPKEKRSAYQRWELDSFDGSKPQKTSATILPTVEQVERIYQQAREEGHAMGYREGQQQAQAEATRLQTLLSELEQALQQFDQQVAQDLLALALEVARKMLGQALKIHPELVLAVVQEAIRCLPHATQHIHLTLHPDDAALVRTHLSDQFSQFDWKIREDPQIGQGGCRVEAGGSEVDATLSTRWQRILASLGQESNWLQ